MDRQDEIVFATYLATELTRGMTDEEIRDFLNLLNQVCCSIGNILNFKKDKKY